MKILAILLLSVSLIIPYSVNFPSSVHASNASIVISHLQTTGSSPGTATEELVVLYNFSAEDTDVTNWCIEYSSASDNTGFEYCFIPPDGQTQLWLMGDSMVSIATQSYVDANPLFVSDFTFSGGMATNSGHIKLYNAASIEQDRLGWGDAISPETEAAIAHKAGEVLTRQNGEIIDTNNNMIDFAAVNSLGAIVSGLYEKEIEIDLCPNINALQPALPVGYLQDERGDCYMDTCLNLDGLQKTVPIGYEIVLNSDECTVVPLENAVLFLSELLPNAPSTDTGNEFIELYNPNAREVDLTGYKLEVGPSFLKNYVFTDGLIAANSYQIFSDTITGITLPNSNGVQLRLVSPAGDVVSTSDLYTSAQDTESWSLVEDNWIWTNQITPRTTNKPFLQPVVNEEEGVTTVFAPCPEGKFRNPDTNRCKNEDSAVLLLTACGPGETRNPETNRCRSNASVSNSLTPCLPGQVRNPDTNRCRSIAPSSSQLQPCDEGEQRNPDTNRCRKVATLGVSESSLAVVSDVTVTTAGGNINWFVITLTVLGLASYMLYEWRVELTRRFKTAKIHLFTR